MLSLYNKEKSEIGEINNRHNRPRVNAIGEYNVVKPFIFISHSGHFPPKPNLIHLPKAVNKNLIKHQANTNIGAYKFFCLNR